jgi:hypothetical protein
MRWCVFAATLTLAGCVPSTNTGGGAGQPLTGRWGGEHVSLDLTSGGGSVEYDCAHGGLSESLRPHAGGRFEARGVHVREHGGPIREGERPDSLPARYVGRVDGSRMTLRVLVGERPDTLGPFELREGAEPRVYRCL